MVPSKPEDFPGTHPGFEGEKKRYLDLYTCWTVQIPGDGCYFLVGDPPSTGWRLRGPTNPFSRIDVSPPPLLTAIPNNAPTGSIPAPQTTARLRIA